MIQLPQVYGWASYSPGACVGPWGQDLTVSGDRERLAICRLSGLSSQCLQATDRFIELPDMICQWSFPPEHSWPHPKTWFLPSVTAVLSIAASPRVSISPYWCSVWVFPTLFVLTEGGSKLESSYAVVGKYVSRLTFSMFMVQFYHKLPWFLYCRVLVLTIPFS